MSTVREYPVTLLATGLPDLRITAMGRGLAIGSGHARRLDSTVAGVLTHRACGGRGNGVPRSTIER